MGFVDGEERDVLLLQKIERARYDQPLRRHIEQSQLAGFDLAGNVALLAERVRAVHRRGWNAARGEAIDLILHQRQQRRYDDCQPFATHRRRLEAERLAAARRHHDERIAVFQNALHCLALQRQIVVEAPILLEDLLQSVVRHSSTRVVRRG